MLQEDSLRALGGCHPLNEECRAVNLNSNWHEQYANSSHMHRVHSLTISFVLFISIY